VISLNSAEDDANTFYKDYVVMTDDIIGAVGDYFNEKPQKKSYEELVKTLSQKFNPHMCFIIDHVHKKLLSISNGTQDEVVHEQTATIDDVSANEATEVAIRDKI
jgi:hypothetical protein